MSDVVRFIPRGTLGTPGTVVDDLVARLDSMEEIYVFVKDKDGSHDTYLSGNLCGLAFALLVLQKRAQETEV